jgi:hypothetical protein
LRAPNLTRFPHVHRDELQRMDMQTDVAECSG